MAARLWYFLMEVEEEFFDEKYSLEETFFSCELPRED